MKTQKKGIKARIVDGIEYKNNSAYVRYLLKTSHQTMLDDADIAILGEMTPQTVYAIKMKMLGLK